MVSARVSHLAGVDSFLRQNRVEHHGHLVFPISSLATLSEGTFQPVGWVELLRNPSNLFFVVASQRNVATSFGWILRRQSGGTEAVFVGAPHRACTKRWVSQGLNPSYELP